MIGCTTLENRRDLYFPQTVEGPYTRMMSDGIPTPEITRTVVVVSEVAVTDRVVSDYKTVR